MKEYRGMLLGLGALGLAFAAGFAYGQAKPPAANVGFKPEVLAALDLTGQLDSAAGYKLRLARITIEPGGKSALHSHQDRLEAYYVLQGALVNHVEGQADQVLDTGTGGSNDKTVTHWVENKGAKAAVVLQATIAK